MAHNAREWISPSSAAESKVAACQEAADRQVSTVIANLVSHHDRADLVTLGAAGDQKAGEPGPIQPTASTDSDTNNVRVRARSSGSNRV